ncbi:hypothetical protein [Streptomyces melanosporofaciens]|uniref:Uncharacterized protein n=1 Tax=Streptomyces melanosporofaciens TaxID=67327 RepID=A0A1H4VSX2_STRMJ|nr:hypothetical protein [Streptomyces melanosporofaciens]SEC83511.1 hypothetical protein SAMN04490356_5720 [Streptomyces melanosporofaciens]
MARTTENGRRTWRRRWSALAALLAGAAVGTTAVIAAVDRPQHLSEQVIVAHGSDNLPNRTATDWVTYADHVLAVTAVNETESPPTDTEVERGEGLIARKVTLRVDRVVWSRDDAPTPAPAQWQRTSVGWQFTDGDTDNRMKMVRADSPRVETGHSYLMAVYWQPDACLPVGGEWLGLGEGATVPYDDDTIGVGEYEGKVRSAQQAVRQARTAAAADGGTALEDALAGRDASAVAAVLGTAQPVERVAYDDPAPAGLTAVCD